MAKITGIVDIGSNSIRLVVIAKTSSFGFHILAERKIYFRLAENLNIDNYFISEIKINGLKSILANFISTLKFYRCRKILAIATSALRGAGNKNAIIKIIKRELDLNIKVISGSDEAYLAAIAVNNLLNIASCNVLDIGGGSVEFAAIRNHQIVRCLSFKAGAVRLKALYKANTQKLKEFLEQEISIPKDLRHKNLVCIGGNMRAIARSFQQHIHHPFKDIHGLSFNYSDFQDFSQDLMEDDQELMKYNIDNQRLDLIHQSLYIFKTAVKKLSTERIIISAASIREGLYLKDILKNKAKRFPANICPSVQSLIDRFLPKRDFGNVIKINALVLFDLLKVRHSLDGKYKTALGIAAKLYNIGIYNGFHKRQKYGFMLIMNELIYGINIQNRILIAELLKNQDLKRIKNYHKQDIYDKFLPNNKSMRWLLGILFLAYHISYCQDKNKANLSFQNDTLTIKLKQSHYLIKDQIEKIRFPNKVNIVLKN